jgi:hypothetical protein
MGSLGCSKTKGTAPPTPEGRFEVTVDGALTDTLRGRARYRLADSMLVGLELDIDSVRGVSVELEPRTLALRTYEVVDAELLGVERTGALPGLNAFLVTRNGDFHATAGSLRVSYVTDGAVGATFSLHMEGTFDGVPATEPSLTVAGTVHALRDDS